MNSEQQRSWRLSYSHWWLLLAISAAVLILYLLSLAPTVLWGDDAFFQRTAVTGELRPDGGGHWLWLQLAKLFVNIPLGDMAYRVNLLSAAAGVATIALTVSAAVICGLNPAAAAATGLSLAVAHTFWAHAVRAEVYTVFTLMMALQLLLWITWRPNRPTPIMVAAFLVGVSLLAHQMTLLLMPAAAYLLWRQRQWLNRRQWMLLGLLFILGLVAASLIIYWQVGSTNPLDAFRRYFTMSGIDFSSDMFDFSFSDLAKDGATMVGLLGLNFFGLAGLLGLWGIWQILVRRRAPGVRDHWISLLILYLTSVLFAFSYHVNDQFVFYLPSYLAFSFFIGLGFHSLLGKRGRLVNVAALLIILLIPIVTYNILPKALAVVEVDIPGARNLPGREPNRFFLQPSKHDYSGAADYGHSALQTLPRNAYLLADHTPLETLRYLQEIKGERPDVCLIKIEPGRDLTFDLQQLPEGAIVYLADNNPNYYEMGQIKDADLLENGVVYQLTGVITGGNGTAICQ